MQPSHIANQESQMAVTEEGSNTKDSSGGQGEEPTDHDLRQQKPAPGLTSPEHLSAQ